MAIQEKVATNEMRGPTIARRFFDNICPLNDSRKRPLHLGFQSVLLDSLSTITKCLGTLFTSPNENKLIQEIFRNEHGKNF
jgi:hypothetical protein